MTVYFVVEYNCKSCGAHIKYEDEAPKFVRDRSALVANNKAMLNYNQALEAWPGAGLHVNLASTKYIICIVCGGRIYIEGSFGN